MRRKNGLFKLSCVFVVVYYYYYYLLNSKFWESAKYWSEHKTLEIWSKIVYNFDGLCWQAQYILLVLLLCITWSLIGILYNKQQWIVKKVIRKQKVSIVMSEKGKAWLVAVIRDYFIIKFFRIIGKFHLRIKCILTFIDKKNQTKYCVTPIFYKNSFMKVLKTY